MAYKIGFLSKLFHIAPQTIHYYESMGLLKPKRNKENDYREYDDDSIQRMGTITKLRNAQFPLKDTTSSYEEDSDAVSLLSAYQEQKKNMQRKIQEDLDVLAKLDEYTDLLTRSLLEEKGTWHFEKRNAYYHQAFKNNYPSEEEAVDASRWYENLFWTDTSMLRIKNHYTFSILADAKTFHERIKENGTDVTRTEAGWFATCMEECTGLIEKEYFRDMEENFFRAHKEWKLRSAPFTRTVAVYKRNGRMHMVYEMILPVEKIVN